MQIIQNLSKLILWKIKINSFPFKYNQNTDPGIFKISRDFFIVFCLMYFHPEADLINTIY